MQVHFYDFGAQSSAHNVKMESGIMMMMNDFDDDGDFQSLLSNAIFGVNSLRHMQYQRKDGKKYSGSNKRTKTC